MTPAVPAAIALDDAVGGLVVSGMLLVIGALLMKQAFDRRRQRQLIEETPTEDVESLSLGPSEVKGRAVPAEGAIPAPFSDEDCLVAEWRVEEYYEDDDSSGWRTRSSGVECAPFYLDDGTGRVLVVPDEDVLYEIEKDAEPMFEVRAFQRPPEAVTEFFARRRTGRFDPLESLRSTLDLGGSFEFGRDGGFGFGTGGRRRGDRRYYQNLLRPGEEAYVFGTVQTREDVRSARNPENLVIRRVPEGDEDLQPMFMIADRPEASLTKQRRFALLRFPVGALLATAGVGGILLVVSALMGVDLQVF
jgi:hypothetical protein